MKALMRQLSETNWAEVINNDSCSKNMESFTNTLTQTIDQCIPEQMRYVNHRSLRREPFLTSGLKRSIDKNKRLYGESLESPTAHPMYKNYNNTLCKTIRKAKIVFYKDKWQCSSIQCQKDQQFFRKIFLWSWKEICRQDPSAFQANNRLPKADGIEYKKHLSFTNRREQNKKNCFRTSNKNQ